MKRSSVILVLLLSALSAVACGSDTKTAAPTGGTATEPGKIQGDPTPICGTGDDTRPASVAIAKLDQASGPIAGAGSTFVAPLMTFWSSEFEKAQGAEVKYDSVGSGAGVARISAAGVDFGASEAPMTDAELAAAKGGPLLHIPLVFGAVVPAYHLTGQKSGLKFTGDVLGKIFAGRITRWNDPELTALNPQANLPSTAITAVHRSDSSGTTAIFTDYLTKASPGWVQSLGGEAKSSGRDIAWPVGNPGKGNEGVSAIVNQTEGTIGYVELTYALSNGLQVGFVQNKAGHFIQPCVETVTAAARDIAIPPDLRFDLTDTPGNDAYPITGTTWALVYEHQNDQQKAKTLVNFLVYCLDEGQTKARGHNYAPVSSEVRSLAIEQVKKITVDGKPVAQ